MRATTAVLCLALLPSAHIGTRAAAQEVDRPLVSFEVRTGFGWATTELGRTPLLDGAGYVDFSQPEGTATLGAGATLSVFDHWALRLVWDRALDTNVAGQWFCAPFVACPAVAIRPAGRLRRWTAAADLVFRPAATALAAPVLFGGIGMRHSALTWTSPLEALPIPTTYDASDAVVRIGVGASRAVGPLVAFAELSGTVGGFGSGEERTIEGSVPDGRVTNVDLGLVVGARRGFF